MFRVLLVDDEPLARNGLRTLMDYRRYGFDICGEAPNGETALALIAQSPPDVAILDVNMPGMNGVDLNRTIKERYPDVQTIMLSSYDDYDYVRDCLKNGSVDYLLKHRLEGEALLLLLNKAVREKRLAVTGQAERGDRGAAEEPVQVRPEAIRGLIVDVVRDRPGAVAEMESTSRKQGLYQGAACYAAAVLQIVPFKLLTESNTDVQTNRLVQQAVDLMQQSLGDIAERTAAYVEDGRIIVVFAFRERSEHAAASEAGRGMSKLRHALELYLNLKSIYAVGHVCGSLAQLRASYASAERSLDATVATTGASQATGQGPKELRSALTIEEQKQLLLAIERLDERGVQRLIASIFDSVRSQPPHSLAVQMFVSELLHIGEKALRRGGASVPSAKETDRLPSRGELGRLGSTTELEKWLQTYYVALLKLLKERHMAGGYSRHVSQAIGFILEQYSTFVTLEAAAGVVGLNPSYLSRIFKEETQSTFSEYVNRVRVDAARRLLESGQYSIKQISDQVGFSTHNYFFKVFKEATGMTPQAYWNSLGDGKTAGAKA